VDRPAAVVERADRHSRWVVPRTGAVAERTAWQPLPDLHGAARDLQRLLLRPRLSGRSAAARRADDLGPAHEQPDGPEHRIPQLARGLPHPPPLGVRRGRRSPSTVLAGLAGAPDRRRILALHETRGE